MILYLFLFIYSEYYFQSKLFYKKVGKKKKNRNYEDF